MKRRTLIASLTAAALALPLALSSGAGAARPAVGKKSAPHRPVEVTAPP